MTNYLRPDEKSALADIEQSKRQDTALKSGLKTVGNLAIAATGIGASAKGLSSFSSRILPLLNKYIPTEMAIKGISKISPEAGNLLKKGMSHGLNIQDGLDFIKEQISPKDNRNIIQQYSPELHQFIDEQVKNGRSAIEAGAIAQNDKRFKGVIDKLTKDHKTPWSNILESVYGGMGQAQQQQGQPQQMQQGQQQGGQGLDPAVMQILQQGNAILQQFKGKQ